MYNQLLKTKTLKLTSSQFTKVKMKLKVIQVEFDFYNGNERKEGVICMLGFVDNKKYISSVLKQNHKLNDEDIETIMDFLSTTYKLDLSKVME